MITPGPLADSIKYGPYGFPIVMLDSDSDSVRVELSASGPGADAAK
jgi:hypothetical protein